MFPIPDRGTFQKSFETLPLVSYQAGETVIVDGAICLGNITVSSSRLEYASHAKSDRGTLCCDNVGPPTQRR